MWEKFAYLCDFWQKSCCTPKYCFSKYTFYHILVNLSVVSSISRLIRVVNNVFCQDISKDCWKAELDFGNLIWWICVLVKYIPLGVWHLSLALCVWKQDELTVLLLHQWLFLIWFSRTDTAQDSTVVSQEGNLTLFVSSLGTCCSSLSIWFLFGFCT